jgi:spore coat polysaccharide biosynthesis protein SpsF (cytidylyltransferase family)
VFDAAIVLQARAGSARLPGKVLADIGGATLVRRCMDRLIAGGVAPVVLATTQGPADDPVAAEGEALGIPVVRGSEADVLDRFAAAARLLGSRFIVRATADNPAVDIDAPRRSLRALIDAGADYCCEAALPLGTAVEAMTTETLLDAHARATEPYDREHVTPFIRRQRRRYRAIEPLAPPRLRRPDLRLTVDTPEDLARMRAIAERLGEPLSQASLRDIIAAVDLAAPGARAMTRGLSTSHIPEHAR